MFFLLIGLVGGRSVDPEMLCVRRRRADGVSKGVWCLSCGHDVDMVKDASESLAWGVTNGMARGEHHLLARPRKIVTWQRPNLERESNVGT